MKPPVTDSPLFVTCHVRMAKFQEKEFIFTLFRNTEEYSVIRKREIFEVEEDRCYGSL